MNRVTEPWFLINSGVGAPAFNMALDEALMLSVAAMGRPVLRFYGWNEPAATFGYFQHWAEIGRITRLRPLLRRPTGGGLVPHNADWTYSVAIPPSHPWYALKAAQSYERMHEWIRCAFARLGVQTELAPASRKELPGQCFAGYEQFDLLWGGRKIAGAAQRRAREGLLIQGSVQPPPPGVERAAWEAAMLQAAGEFREAEWQELNLSPELIATAQQLVETKYSRAEYNGRR